MYGAAGSTRLRSYPPRLGFSFQPESASASLVGPCYARLPQEYSLTMKEQHGFGRGDKNHCPSSCHADISFQHTPTSSNENTGSMSSGQDQMRRSHKVVVGGNSYSRRNEATVVSNKSRIKWTQHLHDKFMECVGILGGIDKATPKGILRLMGVQGLTIYHVKSHLQKYRVTRFVSDSTQVKLKKSTPVINLDTGKQLAESLQMQLDVQMQLHEQLQVQKALQLKIEEQGRQLTLLLEQRLKQQQQQPKDNNSPILRPTGV